ncbi:hypothetical protein GGR53DRAFT_256518 [Hypoxylon sp. FL1150]|nr:hypothetical protein GGR53DRAFT_256518 [Hypoxylon sp. FL1150]
MLVCPLSGLCLSFCLPACLPVCLSACPPVPRLPCPSSSRHQLHAGPSLMTDRGLIVLSATIISSDTLPVQPCFFVPFPPHGNIRGGRPCAEIAFLVLFHRDLSS